MILLIPRMLKSEGSCRIMSMNYSTQGLEDTSHLRTVRLIGSMRIYGHEIFNSRTQRYFSKGIRNSTLQGLELEDTTSLKDAQLTKFLRNYGHETTRLDGLRNIIELMHTTLVILLLTSSKLSPNQYFISKD
uniref:Uncharacterized protein n=1 Tax=Solanum tuberosum TaxID=4113 RepID=M1DBM6_SOLTU